MVDPQGYCDGITALYQLITASSCSPETDHQAWKTRFTKSLLLRNLGYTLYTHIHISGYIMESGQNCHTIFSIEGKIQTGLLE